MHAGAFLVLGLALLLITFFVSRPLLDRAVESLLAPQHRPLRELPELLAGIAIDECLSVGGSSLSLRRFDPPGGARGVVVLVHAWGGDAGRMAGFVDPLLRRGFASVLVDLRGHGRSDPHPGYNGGAILEDIRAVRDWLAGDPVLGGLPVGLVGYSFSGLASIVSVARDPRWSALVVIAAPSSAHRAMGLFLSARGLPGRLVVGALRGRFARAFGTRADTFSAEAMLPSIEVPVLVVHGTEDEVVPLSEGHKMASLVPERLRSSLWVTGADHRRVREDSLVTARVAEFFSGVF